MMVLLTGGTGSVGQEVAKRLARGGHLVRVVGRRPGQSIPGAEYRSCDVTDFDALIREMRGCNAVIHLAALPTPLSGPAQEVFRVNCHGSFAVYQAAAELGIRRVVCASSINALGFNFGVKTFPIRYLPLDEEHPTHTTDAYSFSKQVVEEVAAYFWRRAGISGCCLRLPWVVNATPEAQARVRRTMEQSVPTLREWFRLPQAEGMARAREVIDSKEQARSSRMEEYPADYRHVGELRHAAIMEGYSNFFAQLDARDSAQAFEKALLGSYEGSQPLFVNDSVNSCLLDSRELARLFYPGAEIRRSLSGPASLVSIERARRLIGFEPEYTIDRILG
jgi:nucleoside-diphosphate-sugar epimerase